MAPNSSSFACVVVTEPLPAAVVVPFAEAVLSSVLTPEYSRMRRSGQSVLALNVAVILFAPAAAATTLGA